MRPLGPAVAAPAPALPKGLRRLDAAVATAPAPDDESAVPSEIGASSADWQRAPSSEPDGSVEAIARGAGQGATLGFGDELAAAANALVPNQAGDKGYLQRYRDARDSFRRENAEAQAAHPLAYGIGEAVGALPVSVAAGGAPASGAGRMANALRNARAAAALGGVSAAGASTKEDVPGEALDAAKGAATGGLLSLGLSALAGTTLPLASKAREVFIKQGRRVLQGGANPMSALQRPISEAAVEEVGNIGGFRPLGTTAGTDARVDAAREAVGDQYAAIVQALKARGFVGPDAEALAQKMAAEGRSIASTNTNPAVRGVYDSEAAALRAQEPATTGASPDYTVRRDSNGNLDLTQAEDLKRSLQQRAKYNRVNVAETPQNDARKDVARMIREANEDAIDRQAAASADPVTQAIASQFVPAKQQLGRLIEAGDALDKGVAQAARRSGSLHGTIAAAPALAAGDLAGAAKSMFLDSLWRQRGPSTLAWGARGVSNALQAPKTAAIIDFLRRGAPLAAEEIGSREGSGQ